MQNRKIYTATHLGTIVAHGTANANFSLPLNQREVKVRSMTWDWYSRLNVGQNLITKFNNTTQEIGLYVFAVNTLPVASLVTPLAPGNIANNGDIFRFYTPGHYVFDSFYSENDLQIGFNQLNQDLINVIDWWNTIIFEIEIL